MARITESLTALLIAINVATRRTPGSISPACPTRSGERRPAFRRQRRRKARRGLYEILGAELTVIANTGDDIEIYGAHVSPDPDLITYWLADRIDDRGWGLAGDSFAAMEMLGELGVDVWFNLGDRDLALCLERRRLLEQGLGARPRRTPA
jgi:hypothetical protein